MSFNRNLRTAGAPTRFSACVLLRTSADKMGGLGDAKYPLSATGRWLLGRFSTLLLVGATLPLLLVAVACKGAAPHGDVAPGPGNLQGASYARPGLLADPQWLEENLESEGLVILDVRAPASYNGDHIPGAVNLSPRALDNDEPVHGMVGPPEQVKQALEKVGVKDDSQVIIYDADRSMWAARVFWVLDYYGKGNVSVLNGGFARWQQEGRPVSTEAPWSSRGELTLTADETGNATKEYVLDSLDRSGVVILDERTPGEYAGETVLSARGGHIPGAVNVPWDEAMTEGDMSIWKSPAELQQLYREAGVTPDKEVIVYCQTGVRASHTYLTLTLMGYDNVRVYDGSWEEWGNDTSLPLERG